MKMFYITTNILRLTMAITMTSMKTLDILVNDKRKKCFIICWFITTGFV